MEVTVRGDSFVLQDVDTASGLQRTVRGYILTAAKRVGLMSSVLAVNNKNNNNNNGRRRKLWKVRNKCLVLMAMTVSPAYTHPRAHQVAHMDTCRFLCVNRTSIKWLKNKQEHLGGSVG